MEGWKTWTGAAVIFLSGGLMSFADLLPQYYWLSSIAQAIMSAGAALGLVGLGHKVEKSGK